jgi:purine-nucleoside phosphorylase
LSFHIEAKKDDIAQTVLLPGDPMRAKYIAENFLDDYFCYNSIRGMYGYTGYFNGKKVSIQGTGMGIPSISIYVNELIKEYNVNNLIRLGTCCAIQQNIKIRDIVLAIGASSNSSINNAFFKGEHYAPCCDFLLLKKAYEIILNEKKQVYIGNVLTSDFFYHLENEDYWKLWAKYGVLVMEMETAGLYTLAARYGVSALSIMTVSDSVYVSEELSSKDKEKNLNDMLNIAFQII